LTKPSRGWQASQPAHGGKERLLADNLQLPFAILRPFLCDQQL
jgi:hypothetical protein